MCSILDNIILKDLTSIVREYLLPNKNKYDIVSEYYILEFMNKYYLLQMKRLYPQKEYIIHNSNYYHSQLIKFNVSDNFEKLQYMINNIFPKFDYYMFPEFDNHVRYNSNTDLDFFLFKN